jgi:cytochrome c oxidase subunit III
VPPAQAGPSITGSRNPAPVFGMVLFLASELMFFGGLFASYFTLRTSTSTWPPADVELDLPLTLVATGILVASSFTMHAGLLRLRAGDDGGMRRWVSLTILLGAGFLAIKGIEFSTASFGIDSHAYGSLWFTMLGAHGAHLLVGIVLLLWLVSRGSITGPGTARGEAVGYYWHFVDGVWLAIFGIVYLIR